MSGGFARVGERLVHQGHVISLGVGTFRGPDGATFERDVVHHPGAVSVVPLHDDGRVLLVRQYRAPLDGWLLEIPAGKRDVPGEDPALTAARELEEEVGRRATTLELLGEFHNSPGFCDEHSFVYLATGLEQVPDARQGVEEAAMTLEWLDLDAVPDAIADGTLRDAKTIIGLLLALRRLGR